MPINAGHVAATGSTTALVAQVLVYATHWPLQPLDAETAMSLAGLITAGVGALVMLARKRWSLPTTTEADPNANH